MRNKNQIYKLLWWCVPLIFLFFFAMKGRFCLMFSCTGDNNLGIAYGIGAVIVYSLLLKVYNGLSVGNWKHFWGPHREFLYTIVILIVVLVYFLGKVNGQ